MERANKTSFLHTHCETWTIRYVDRQRNRFHPSLYCLRKRSARTTFFSATLFILFPSFHIRVKTQVEYEIEHKKAWLIIFSPYFLDLRAELPGEKRLFRRSVGPSASFPTFRTDRRWFARSLGTVADSDLTNGNVFDTFSAGDSRRRGERERERGTETYLYFSTIPLRRNVWHTNGKAERLLQYTVFFPGGNVEKETFRFVESQMTIFDLVASRRHFSTTTLSVSGDRSLRRFHLLQRKLNHLFCSFVVKVGARHKEETFISTLPKCEAFQTI